MQPASLTGHTEAVSGDSVREGGVAFDGEPVPVMRYSAGPIAAMKRRGAQQASSRKYRAKVKAAKGVPAVPLTMPPAVATGFPALPPTWRENQTAVTPATQGDGATSPVLPLVGAAGLGGEAGPPSLSVSWGFPTRAYTPAGNPGMWGAGGGQIQGGSHRYQQFTPSERGQGVGLGGVGRVGPTVEQLRPPSVPRIQSGRAAGRGVNGGGVGGWREGFPGWGCADMHSMENVGRTEGRGGRAGAGGGRMGEGRGGWTLPERDGGGCVGGGMVGGWGGEAVRPPNFDPVRVGEGSRGMRGEETILLHSVASIHAVVQVPTIKNYFE